MNTLERAWCNAVHELDTCSLCGAYGIEWSHRNEGKGMGMKTPPYMTAALCKDCHYRIDNGKDLSRDERRALMDKAIVITHARMIENGSLALKR